MLLFNIHSWNFCKVSLSVVLDYFSELWIHLFGHWTSVLQFTLFVCQFMISFGSLLMDVVGLVRNSSAAARQPRLSLKFKPFDFLKTGITIVESGFDICKRLISLRLTGGCRPQVITVFLMVITILVACIIYLNKYLL